MTAKTAVERNREYEQKRKAEGWQRIQVWVHPKTDQAALRKYIAAKNKKAGAE